MKVMEMGRVFMNTLFGPIPEISNDELDEYRQEHKVDSYTLLDVRQPKEYDEDHIPGAKLIPLPELSKRMDELDSGKPVIAYCAIGGRSRAAAEFLAGRGFKEVYSLKGGIKQWEGVGADGPVESGLGLISGDESPARALAVAHGMESGLGDVYRKLAAKLEDEPTAELLTQLAQVENAHKQKVLDMFEAAGPNEDERKYLDELAGSGLVEGGYEMEALLAKHADAKLDSEDVLDMAMTIESQAMDLYMRLAGAFKDKAAQDAMHELSDDELKHLDSLAKLRDDKAA